MEQTTGKNNLTQRGFREASFVYNDSSKGEKVLSTLEKQLRECQEFMISVAFITQSGIVALLPVLKEFGRKKYKGKNSDNRLLIFFRP